MVARAAGGDLDPAQVHARIAEYYTQKVKAFGSTPLGVDWTCQPTQEMRFVQLLKLCDFSAPFSINDLGCGYGALAAFMHRRHGACAVDYLGIDLSGEMVRRARRRYRMHGGTRFATGSASPRAADYSVASGIFNVQLDVSAADWDAFITTTLQHLAATSQRGFAVNFVAAPPDGQRVKQGLYTTPPGRWVEYCANQIGADVQLIDGYGMHEFSLLVRRRPAV
ncbi:MAG TPA: class I SAM-dependent methyltransferase [Acetobacteraceae bacterium]|nr:class I SAM-dependent methyltransferase [Acetobacteraceae bacterium]